MIVVSYGGGTNSCAMLVGLHEHGERPDHILFADTGGEKPHTYEHIRAASAWCESVGFPPIVTVKQVTREGRERTLEENCLEEKMLPSIAYGFKSCSMKYKKYPQDKYYNNHPDIKGVWARGEKVVKCMGFDAGEPHRAARGAGDEKYILRFPLIEWGWEREDCVAAIRRAGLEQPGKSACFFCPSSKKHEVMALRRDYPELAARAVAMEKNADLTSVVGLGRTFAWGELYAADAAQAKLFPETHMEIPCDCYDDGAA